MKFPRIDDRGKEKREGKREGDRGKEVPHKEMRYTRERQKER